MALTFDLKNGNLERFVPVHRALDEGDSQFVFTWTEINQVVSVPENPIIGAFWSNVINLQRRSPRPRVFQGFSKTMNKMLIT